MIKCTITVDGDKYTAMIDRVEKADGEWRPVDEIFHLGGTIGSKDLMLDANEWRGEVPVPELVKFIKGLKIIVKILKALRGMK